MTTAAPPEKMTPLEYYGGHRDNCVPGQGGYDEPPEPCSCGFDEAVHMAREAARRLAPRVGDDAVANIAAYLEANFPCDNPERSFEADKAWVLDHARSIAALSAPPAASADEMELEAHILTFFPDNPHSARACALTYRKRAAQVEP